MDVDCKAGARPCHDVTENFGFAIDEAQQKFVEDFVNVWNKVMNLDRFDLL